MPVPPPVTTAVLFANLLMVCSFVEVAHSWRSTHLLTSMHLLVSICHDTRSLGFHPAAGPDLVFGPGLHPDPARVYMWPRRNPAGHCGQVEASDPLLPRPRRSDPLRRAAARCARRQRQDA